MIKYAKITDEKTGMCDVGIGDNEKYYQMLGMEKKDVKLSEVNGKWYLASKLNNEDYKKQLRLKEIEQELKDAQDAYNTLIDTPLEYPVNGKIYKPSYAKDDYADLLLGGQLVPDKFPIKIDDATHLEENAVMMTYEELSALSMFLVNAQQNYYETYRTLRSALLEEKAALQII